MTESQFIEKNREKWQELESLLHQTERDADRLHILFVEVSSDLSYARTFYANRSVRLYLNNLTQQVLDTMGRRKTRFDFTKALWFFKQTLPREVLRSRNAFFVSLFVFIASVGIGVISSANNPEFVRVILGDEYVQITEENINEGDPMAIYKDERKVDMFLGITINNIQVAFFAFVLGLFGSIGTVILLMMNGIMLGAFQYFFYSKGLFMTSFLTIWIHGTIEISAIIIAGAAGIILGNGLLFPGTFDRLLSLQVAAKRALRILLGTVPLFVLAGILESFVTRYTGLPTVVKAGIIGGSLLLILLMWLILPLRMRNRTEEQDEYTEFEPEHYQQLYFKKLQYRTVSESLVLAFAQIRQFMGVYLTKIVIPGLLLFALIGWYKLNTLTLQYDDLLDLEVTLFSYKNGGFTNFILFVVLFSTAMMLLARYVKENVVKLDAVFFRQYAPLVFLISFVMLFPFYFLPVWIAILMVLLLSPQMLFVSVQELVEGDGRDLFFVKTIYSFSMRRYMQFLPAIGIALFFAWLLLSFFNSGVASFIVTFVGWHELFEYQVLDKLFISQILDLTAILLVIPLAYFLIVTTYYSQRCWTGALDLRDKFKVFGGSNTVLE